MPFVFELALAATQPPSLPPRVHSYRVRASDATAEAPAGRGIGAAAAGGEIRPLSRWELLLPGLDAQT